MSVRNGRQEIEGALIDSVLKIDIRKLLAEPKWVFIQTIYSRVVFTVTHIAFDKMERIKMTEIYNIPYGILTDVLFHQIYGSKV